MKRLVGAWLLCWSILAIVHVTQAIWLSGFAAYPGDLGDGRFNQLILEHGFQSLRGVYAWSSPGQFYPTPNTLGLSDTHAGTLPIYVLLRVCGFSLDDAWQAWFIAIAILNTLAALRLFSALRIATVLRGPLVFASVSSVPMVWLAGTHMQMLPLFPLVFAWGELARWTSDRGWNRLLTALGWFAWQFAAAPYIAFLGGACTAFVGIAWIIGRSSSVTIVTRVNRRRKWLRAIVILAIGGSLALASARIYSASIQAGAGRPMREIIDLAPTVKSWFTAPPTSFYPTGWPGGDHELVERAWFAGFIIWILLPVALILGWRHRRESQANAMFALAAGALATIGFFTRWSESSSGLWIWVANLVEPFRAFRSSGRVGGILVVAEMAAAGLLLSHWYLRQTSTATRVVPVVAAFLLALENVAHHQPSTLLAEAKARSDAVITQWKEHGNRPVLAFAPGPTNQPDVYLQLDAWAAALRLKRFTVNGYTGGIPGTHQAFIWNSTPQNARKLATATGIPEQQLSIIESFGPDANQRLNLVRSPTRPLPPLNGFDLQPATAQLYAPLEFFVLEGHPMYQFTPDAVLTFELPDSAKVISYWVGLRPDAYIQGGKSDGCGVTWSVESSGQPRSKIAYEFLDPVNQPAHRGMLQRELVLPPGHNRILELRTDTGPAHSLPWDFLLVGELRIR